MSTCSVRNRSSFRDNRQKTKTCKTGKVEIGDGEQFAIDVDKMSATVNGNEIHDRLVYTVNA